MESKDPRTIAQEVNLEQTTSKQFTVAPTSFHKHNGVDSSRLNCSDFTNITYITPTGMMTPYAGTTAPTNWLLCDGSAVSRFTYGALFAVIGTAYGAGNGTTTFNLPDMRGRVAVGKNSGTFTPLGATGGAETVTLSVGQLPSHNHGVTDPGHHHTVTLSSTLMTAGGDNSAKVSSGTTNTSTDVTGITIDNTGSGNPVSVLQPYQVFNFIIRI